jgi:outer membrane phospholipase A
MSTGDEWPNIEVSRTDDDNPELAALGYAAFDLSSRVHDLINAVGEATTAPTWVGGLRAAMGR